MRIMTLNTWGGRAGKEKLLAFFEAHRDSVDVFCLQEMWSAPYEHIEGFTVGGRPLITGSVMTQGLQEISEVLDTHVCYFRPHHLDNYGLTMFVRRGIEVLEEGEVFVHRHKGYMPEGDIGLHARNIQYVTVLHNGGPLTVINFHGLWNGQGKGDSDDRIAQSEKILAFTNALPHPFVFGGDFNLNPDTESVRLLEAKMRNLISDYAVTSTRTSLYDKSGLFADYMFVSDGVEVIDFKVLPDEVSDHAPLVVDIA